MKSILRVATLWLAYLAFAVSAQTVLPTATPPNPPKLVASPERPADAMQMAQTFYELLLAELSLIDGDIGQAYSLTLDLAKRSGDGAAYRRATEIALQSRSGEAALQAAQAWVQALPQAREAQRYLTQVLIALNRPQAAIAPLQAELAIVDATERPELLLQVGRYFQRLNDKRAAADAVQKVVQPYLTAMDTGPAAWTVVGLARLAAQDISGAEDALRQSLAPAPEALAPMELVLALMMAHRDGMEPLLLQRLNRGAPVSLRLAYVRALLSLERYADAQQQAQTLVDGAPDQIQAWFILGSLQLEQKQVAQAEKSLLRVLELGATLPQEERQRVQSRSYLLLSRIAQQRQDWVGADAWLAKVNDESQMFSAASQRAALLSRQGKTDEALALTREAGTDANAREGVLAQLRLLRDAKRYTQAYDLLAKALSDTPQDTEFLYEQAMVAEKLDQLGTMETLLRQVILLKPDAYHAYNALGYSLAERNTRLVEARSLIEQALKYAPTDPFINDSLGWVEFRLGHAQNAKLILEAAYKARPDPEIAAHLGEVLWSLGQHDQAQRIWQDALQLDDANDTLNGTLQRLRVKP